MSRIFIGLKYRMIASNINSNQDFFVTVENLQVIASNNFSMSYIILDFKSLLQVSIINDSPLSRVSLQTKISRFKVSILILKSKIPSVFSHKRKFIFAINKY